MTLTKVIYTRFWHIFRQIYPLWDHSLKRNSLDSFRNTPKTTVTLSAGWHKLFDYVAAFPTTIPLRQLPDIRYAILRESTVWCRTFVSYKRAILLDKPIFSLIILLSLVDIHESRMHLQETCKCPPDCNSVSFDASMAKVPIFISNYTEDYF